jgi:hypothetical protein
MDILNSYKYEARKIYGTSQTISEGADSGRNGKVKNNETG